MAEPVTLQEAKDYLRILDSTEDTKISNMITRARLWVEDHTGFALVQRQFVEKHVPKAGRVSVNYYPVISIGGVTYLDSEGVEQSYAPRSYPPSRTLLHGLSSSWPTLNHGEEFTVTYTAGPDATYPVDERHKGAILALVEGEYTEGFAYTDSAIEAAKGCCFNTRKELL